MKAAARPPEGHLSMADFWIQLRALVKTRPTFARQGWPKAIAASLNELEDRDEELEQIARSKGLRMFVPICRAEMQEPDPSIESGMIYSFFDSDGHLVAELTGYSRTFVWLHKEAEAIVLDRHLASSQRSSAPVRL